MPRSFFHLLTQVGTNDTYDDAVANAHTATAESQENLEDFLNIGLLTQLKDLKGLSNWYDVNTKTLEQLALVPTTDEVCRILYEKHSTTLSTGASAANTSINTWLSGEGITTFIDEADGTQAGYLASLTKGDAAAEGGLNKVAITDANNDPIEDNAGNPVYAYIVTDNLTTPTATSIYYYSMVGETETPYTFAADTSIKLYVPRQYAIKDMPRNAIVDVAPLVAGLAEEANIGSSTFTEQNFVTNEATVTANL